MQQGEPDKKGPGTLVGNPPGFSPVTAESFVESGVRWVPTRTAATSGVRMPTNGGLLLRDGAADGVSAGDARLEKRVVSRQRHHFLPVGTQVPRSPDGLCELWFQNLLVAGKEPIVGQGAHPSLPIPPAFSVGRIEAGRWNFLESRTCNRGRPEGQLRLLAFRQSSSRLLPLCESASKFPLFFFFLRTPVVGSGPRCRHFNVITSVKTLLSKYGHVLVSRG